MPKTYSFFGFLVTAKKWRSRQNFWGWTEVCRHKKSYIQAAEWDHQIYSWLLVNCSMCLKHVRVDVFDKENTHAIYFLDYPSGQFLNHPLVCDLLTDDDQKVWIHYRAIACTVSVWLYLFLFFLFFVWYCTFRSYYISLFFLFFFFSWIDVMTNIRNFRYAVDLEVPDFVWCGWL